MATFVERLIAGAMISPIYVPLAGVSGYLGGYIYSKLADLPPASQTAKMWAIYSMSINALHIAAGVITENPQVRALFKAAIYCGGTALFIRKMRELELLGNKMTVFMVVLNGLFTIGQLAVAAGLVKPASKKDDAQQVVVG